MLRLSRMTRAGNNIAAATMALRRELPGTAVHSTLMGMGSQPGILSLMDIAAILQEIDAELNRL